MKTLEWTDSELRWIRDDVFGSCTTIGECYDLEDLRKELTVRESFCHGDKPYKTRKAALRALLEGEKVRMARDQEDFCYSCWNKVDAGVMTTAAAEKRIKGYKAEVKAITKRIKTLLAEFY